METLSTQSFVPLQLDHDYSFDNLFEEISNISDHVNQVPEEPSLCPILSAEIFKNLGILEKETRPDFLKVHSDRALCVDWLVCIADDHGLVKDPEALYLAVNYLDRYLYVNPIVETEKLFYIGMTCLMIAIKYEQEVNIPSLNDYVFLAENRFSAQDFIQLEYTILRSLDFKMTTPTSWCFLVRYLSIVRDHEEDFLFDGPRLDCLAKYITWLSLFSHSVLCYLPSTIAASSVFLAKYILKPNQTPWNETLAYYTKYQPCNIRECVFDLFELCLMSRTSNMLTIKDKYARLVSAEFQACPSTIPHEYFDEI